MSPLPEKRKSAEEIAELRKTLGIPGEGAPTEDAAAPLAPDPRPEPAADEPPEPAPQPEAPEPEPPAGERSVPEVPKLLPKHSLRKSEQLVVDQPKKAVARDSGELPVHRHSERELMQLRRAQSGPATPPAVQLEKLGAHPAALGLLYGAGVLGCGLAMLGVWASTLPPMDLPFDWLAAAVVRPGYRMVLFGILAGGAGIMLLGAGWIGWRKKRSSHHAGILTILAVLVLVFGTLYFFPQLHGA